MYADYDFYKESFHGDVLTPDNAVKWLSRAGDELDALTCGRLAFAFPVQERHELKTKKAVCAVAEVLCTVDLHRRALMPSETEGGALRGPVTSLSSGQESMNFGTGAGASAYAQAAQSEESLQELIARTAVKHLANVPDACGINLLYRGSG